MSKINSFLDIVNDGETFVDFFLSDDLSHDGIKERSGRYDYGSGDRPYQHDPQKRELYLSVKQDSAEFGSKNGFSKETADKTARIVTVNYDIDTSSIRTGDNFSNSSERIYKNDRTATVNYDIDTSSIRTKNEYPFSSKWVYKNDRNATVNYDVDTSSIGSKNEYSNSSERIYKNDRTATVNHDIDTSSIGSGDKFSNSNRKMYSAGMKYYERKKYASPVFNANPSNEELTSIKNRRRLEKEVRDSFEDKSETKSSNSNQNRSTNAENGGKGNSNTPPTSNAKRDPWARTEKGGKDKPNISQAERLARDVKNTTDDLIDGASKILRSMNDNKKLKNNAKGLSNEELRERIARIRLEKEYNQLTANDTRSGYDKTMRILNTVGTAVSVGAGVVSIVAGVKNMKAGKK